MHTAQEQILDVTQYEPKEKHPTIFRKFDALEDGEVLVLHNDHDPKPLYYQLLAERGEIFEWEYTEKGPRWWKVRICKKRGTVADETMGQIAVKDLRKAAIFKKYGLDFCCGGKKTVREACAEKGLDTSKVEQELRDAERQQGERPVGYNDWSLDFLADYIVQTHHNYIRESMPGLRAYSQKVSRVHGGRHPELKAIYQLVEEIHDELLDHMESEERKVFPLIKGLIKYDTEQPSPQNMKLDLQALVGSMEAEHDTVGRALEEIRSLSKDYAMPADACASYTLLFNALQAFEEDLHLHVHLENNILFPKALALGNN